MSNGIPNENDDAIEPSQLVDEARPEDDVLPEDEVRPEDEAHPEEAVRLDPSRYKQIEPYVARLEAKMTHPTPGPSQLSRDLEEHIKAMR